MVALNSSSAFDIASIDSFSMLAVCVASKEAISIL